MITKAALLLLGSLLLGVILLCIHAQNAASNDAPRMLCTLSRVCDGAFGVNFTIERTTLASKARDTLLIGLPLIDIKEALYAR